MWWWRLVSELYCKDLLEDRVTAIDAAQPRMDAYCTACRQAHSRDKAEKKIAQYATLLSYFACPTRKTDAIDDGPSVGVADVIQCGPECAHAIKFCPVPLTREFDPARVFELQRDICLHLYDHLCKHAVSRVDVCVDLRDLSFDNMYALMLAVDEVDIFAGMQIWRLLPSKIKSITVIEPERAQWGWSVAKCVLRNALSAKLCERVIFKSS